jgi:hypothetical protein
MGFLSEHQSIGFAVILVLVDPSGRLGACALAPFLETDACSTASAELALDSGPFVGSVGG